MYQGTNIMPFYTKTYHRQITRLCISIVWKGTTVFVVVTTHLSGVTCSDCNAWQEGSRSIPAVTQGCYSASLKLWILTGSHSGFNDPILRSERSRAGLSNLKCSSPQRAFELSKKEQTQVRDPEGGRICLMLKQRHTCDCLPYGKG